MTRAAPAHCALNAALSPACAPQGGIHPLSVDRTCSHMSVIETLGGIFVPACGRAADADAATLHGAEGRPGGRPD